MGHDFTAYAKTFRMKSQKKRENRGIMMMKSDLILKIIRPYMNISTSDPCIYVNNFTFLKIAFKGNHYNFRTMDSSYGFHCDLTSCAYMAVCSG